MFDISSLKFAYLQTFAEKRKILNFRLNMPVLGIWGLEFENELSYLKSAPMSLSDCKTLVKKSLKFGTKNA